MKNQKQGIKIKQKIKIFFKTYNMLLGSIILIFIIQPLQAQSQNQPTYFDHIEFDAYVQQAMKDWDVPGLSIAVVKDDSVVFLKGYGVRELGKPGAVDESTLFAAASTTKAFTAAAIGILVDENKLEWDDPVVEHLPWFQLNNPYLTANVTIRDLLAHRTGLPVTDFLTYAQDISSREMFERLVHVKMAYPLRAGYIYNNEMYALAGQVLKKVSGVSWNDFVETRIFDPLGMERSFTRLSEAEKMNNVASPHDYAGEQLQPIQFFRNIGFMEPTGSIRSSAKDMSRWIAFLLRDCRTEDGLQLLEKFTCDELFKPQTILHKPFYPTAILTEPHWTTYGLGWFQQDYEGRKTDFHTGSHAGLVAIAGMIRDENVGIYILANRDHAEVRHALMYRVFDLFDNEPARDWSKELKALYDKRAEEAEQQRAQQIVKMQEGMAKIKEAREMDTEPSLRLEEYAGVYKDSLYGTTKITYMKNKLKIENEYGNTGELKHWHYDTFRLIPDGDDEPEFILLFDFELNTKGEPARLRMMDIEYERVEKKE